VPLTRPTIFHIGTCSQIIPLEGDLGYLAGAGVARHLAQLSDIRFVAKSSIALTCIYICSSFESQEIQHWIIFHKLADSQVEACQADRPSAYASLAVVLQSQVAAADTHHIQAASDQEILVAVLVGGSLEVDLQQDLRIQPGLVEVSRVDLTVVAEVVLSASVVVAGLLLLRRIQAASHSVLHLPLKEVRKALELGIIVG